jgi:uncharacterized protein YkwD/uncharacterized membrane protein required for colicin V production
MVLNWVDWIIIFLVSYEVFQGWKAGFVKIGISFIAFALSLWVSIYYNAPVSNFFSEKFGIAQAWCTLLSYVSIALIGQTILTYMLSFIVSKLPAKIEKSPINSVLGSLVSGVNNLTTIAFVLLIILALPLKGTVQKDIRASTIGGKILSFVETYGGPIKLTANEIKKTAAKFLTVSPGSSSSMPLDVDVKPQMTMMIKERELLSLVNQERVKAGLKTFTVDVKIVAVARAYSKDMFTKKYFSHVSPDGKDLSARLKQGEVKFSQAGENLAFAPDVATAHDGLMNSPEHKKNLLDPAFNHIGIGIISTTKYGIMVTQDFAN